MIYYECFLTYFHKFPVTSDKKELSFGQNFNKLYSHSLFLYLHPKVFTKWHDFRLKQNQKKKKIRLLKGEAHPPQTPPVRSSKSFLNVKARFMPPYTNKEAYIRT